MMLANEWDGEWKRNMKKIDSSHEIDITMCKNL